MYFLNDTCRFCMASDIEDLKDIHEIALETNVLNMLKDFNINIDLDNGLPIVMCKTCVETITKFYDFKQKSLEVEKEFQILMKSSENISTPTKWAQEFNTDYCVITKPQQVVNSANNLEMNETITAFSNSETSNKKHKHKSKHQCEMCGRIFNLKTCFENHLLSHSGLKPYTCEICFKTFSRNENVKIHMRCHLNIKPFICEICGKSSTKRQDLTRHMKVHSHEKNYSCTKCNRKFKRSGDLVSHIRTHSGVRPYSCKQCDKNYTSCSGLRKHLRMHITSI